MKTNKTMVSKRLLRLLIVTVMLITMMTSSMYIVFASASPPSGAAVTDVYSSWAAWEVLTAQSVYGLGSEGVYSNFRGGFAAAKFMSVFDSLCTHFDADFEPDIEDSVNVTRGDIVTALYGLIAEVLELDANASAIDYFVDNGLINGRATGDYQLDQDCTTEEMIAFSVRAYEFLSYELGLYSSGLFWKITGKDMPNTVYLLGTVHLGDSSIYPLSRSIIEAFNNAAYLAVEANIYTISEEDMAYAENIQMITDGSSIKDYISEETYEIYAAIFESFEVPAEVYDFIKPWAAFLGLNQFLMTGGEDDEGTDPLLGIDMYFLSKAFLFGKSIVEVESLRYQMDMLDSFSPELQEMLLLSIIDPSFDEGEDILSFDEIADLTRESMADLVEVIKTGDEAALTEMVKSNRDISDPLASEFYTKLWAIRDAGMVDTIEQFIALEDADGDFFVAVGAGHTIGDTGIVSVLTERGYTVERIK